MDNTTTYTLTQFLRNALSGAREDPKVATEAVLIPVGKRTNLARARTQINALFDRAERALGPQPVDPEVTRAKAARKRHAAKRGDDTLMRRALREMHEGHDAVASALGLAIGAGLAMIPAAMRAVEDIRDEAASKVRGVAAGIRTRVSDTADDVSATSKAMTRRVDAVNDWLTERSQHLVGDVQGLAVDTYHATATWVSDRLKRVQGLAESWSQSSTKAVHEAFDPPADPREGKMPDAEPPSSTVNQVTNGISSFWERVRACIRDWLWSMWTGVKADGTAPPPGTAEAAPTAAPPAGEAPTARPSDAARRGGGGGVAATYPRGDAPRVQSFAPGSRQPDAAGGADARAMYMMDRLVKVHGFTPEGAALSAGNSQQENALRPGGSPGDVGSVAGGSWGAFQWNGARLQHLKDYAASNGRDWRDLDTQIDFHAQDPDRPNTMEHWRSLRDLREGGALSHAYEGYGDDSTGRRLSNAQRFLQMYRAHPPETGQPAAPGVSSGPSSPFTPEQRAAASAPQPAAPGQGGATSVAPPEAPVTPAPTYQQMPPPPAPEPAPAAEHSAGGGDDDHGFHHHGRGRGRPHVRSSHAGLLMFSYDAYA